MEVAGKAIALKTPRQAVRAGIALIPEDRQRDGLALQFPVAYNMTMPDLARISSFGVLNKAKETNLSEEYRKRLRIGATVHNNSQAGSAAEISRRLSSRNGLREMRESFFSMNRRAASMSVRNRKCSKRWTGSRVRVQPS